MIIGGSDRTSLPSRLLALSVPRWIGRISYSLYLWHWPILVLVPLALGIESLALNLVLVGVAVAIAAASTELIEVPIRQGRLLPLAAACQRRHGGVGLGAWWRREPSPLAPSSVALARLPSSPMDRPSAPAQLPEAVRTGPVPADLTPTLAQAYYDLPSGYGDGCHLDFPEVEPPECTYGPADATTPVLLLGDSHAQQWLPALERLADERGWRLRAITKGACPMVEATVWNYPLKRAYRECDEWRERALRLIEEDEPQLVLLAAADMYDLVDEQGGLIRDGPDGEAAEAAAWDAGLADYLAQVAERAPRVVLLADTPRVGYDPAECLATSAGIEACDTQQRAHGR